MVHIAVSAPKRKYRSCIPGTTGQHWPRGASEDSTVVDSWKLGSYKTMRELERGGFLTKGMREDPACTMLNLG